MTKQLWLATLNEIQLKLEASLGEIDRLKQEILSEPENESPAE